MAKVISHDETTPEFQAYMQAIKPIIDWFVESIANVIEDSYDDFGDCERIDVINAITLAFRKIHNEMIEELKEEVAEHDDERGDLN